MTTRITGEVAAARRPPAPPTDESTRVERLGRQAAEAAQLRAYAADPAVVALRVEKVRDQVDRLCWAGIMLGLAFTMTNVQGFAAAGAPVGSLQWLAAWLLDPTVSLVLLAILRAEQVTARYQVRTGPWVRRAKWFTLAATYLMNTWASWADGSPAGVVLHSVPPLVVFVAAEAVTDLRDKLTESANVASGPFMNPGPVIGPNAEAEVHEPARRARRSRKGQRSRPRRVSYADYLAQAHEALSAESAQLEPTPAWVRKVTGCSRGLSSRLASELRAELVADDPRDGGERS